MTTTAMDSNRSAYDRVADEYATRELYPAERRLLERFRERWGSIDVLDLGVGAGRTAFTFGALARTYLGLDYSPQMIALSRRLIGETEAIKFDVADASDLSRYHDRRFDLILFSFNGIDYVDQSKRVAILREVRKLLRGPNSYFYFSTHSLHAYPFTQRLPTLDLRRPVRWSYRYARETMRHWRLRWVNRDIAPEVVKQRGWAIVNDGLHDFSIATHYIMPSYQVEQLREAGFGVTESFDTNGAYADWREPQRDPWMHFLCHPV